MRVTRLCRANQLKLSEAVLFRPDNSAVRPGLGGTWPQACTGLKHRLDQQQAENTSSPRYHPAARLALFMQDAKHSQAVAASVDDLIEYLCRMLRMWH